MLHGLLNPQKNNPKENFHSAISDIRNNKVKASNTVTSLDLQKFPLSNRATLLTNTGSHKQPLIQTIKLSLLQDFSIKPGTCKCLFMVFSELYTL